MIKRNLSVPHRLACVTDMTDGIDPAVEIIPPPGEFEHVKVPTWGEHRPQCFRRLAMFKPNAAELFGEYIVSMDLDCVIAEPLDSLFRDCGEFKIAVGTAPERPYNGSLIYLKAGARPQVYEQFTPQGAAEAGRKFVGSDQAWIAHCLGPDEATWGAADGLVYHGVGRNAEILCRIMFYPGSTKPWNRLHEPWVAENYRRLEGGRCLVLGYDDSVWADVDRALDNGPYDAVISSPEAAEYWPGHVAAVAKDNEEAALLARMLGFKDVTWCGIGEAA